MRIAPPVFAVLELQIVSRVATRERPMTVDREPPESNTLRQRVADEGNVPGQPSTRGIVLLAIFVLIGLGLIYLASSYQADHPRRIPQMSRQ
jgi:hypothetical protein